MPAFRPREAESIPIRTLQIDTTNILFICGGAFDGLEKIVESRLSAGSIGFNAEVVDKNKADIDELLKQAEPQDLVKFGLFRNICR